MGQNKETADYDYAARLIEFKVRSLIGEFGFSEDDREDLQQDLMVHLLERLPQYDPTRAAVRTFMDRILENKIRSIIEHRRYKKRDCCIQLTSLSQTISGNDGDLMSIEDSISHDDCMLLNGRIVRTASELCDLRIAVETALSLLPGNLRSLCERLKTQSIAEITAETGEDRNRINYKIRRIRRLLAKTNLKEYV